MPSTPPAVWTALAFLLGGFFERFSPAPGASTVLCACDCAGTADFGARALVSLGLLLGVSLALAGRWAWGRVLRWLATGAGAPPPAGESLELPPPRRRSLAAVARPLAAQHAE